MKHLTIYLLCLLTLPIYAQKGLHSKLKQDFDISVKTKASLTSYRSEKQLSNSERSSKKFGWDEITNEWFLTGSTWSAYNNNELVEYLEYDAQGLPYSKTTNTIESNKLVVTSVYEIFINGNWEKQTKNIIENDNQGRKLREESFYWNNNQWIMTSGNKTIVEVNSSQKTVETDYIFNENIKSYVAINRRVINSNDGKLEEIITQTPTNEGWVNTSAEGYDYNANGQISNIYYFSFDGIQWKNEELISNIEWHDYHQLQASIMELKVWNGVDWESREKVINQFKMNGGVSSITFNYINNEWVYEMRFEEEFDINKNPKGYKVEKYQDNTWLVLYENVMEYTYDMENRLTQSVLKVNDGKKLTNVYKEVFNYQRTTGIAQQTLELSIFPNPSTDYIQIKTADDKTGELNIYSLSGQLLKTSRIDDASNNKIYVEDLITGIYVVEFKTESGNYISKLSKR